MCSRHYVSLAVAILSLLQEAAAQYSQFTTSPPLLLLRTVRLDRESPLENNAAIEWGLSVLLPGGDWWSEPYGVSGARVSPTLKKYFQRGRPHLGWYGMGYARFTYLRFKRPEGPGRPPPDRRYDYRRTRITIGGGFGYLFVARNGLVLGGSLGVGAHLLDRKRFDGGDVTSRPYDSGFIYALHERDGDISEFTAPVDLQFRLYVGIRRFKGDGERRRHEDYLDRRRARKTARKK